ncbi:MAG: hypothetical protein E7667_06585 [Ruminococcaceae bacterium]|nr:hypothetical protein [Oscillospiraceae bacterium]
MKKLLSLLLAIVMVCGLVALVACGKEEEKTTQAPTTTPTEPPVEDPELTGAEAAAEYVRQLYKDKKVTSTDFTVIPSIIHEEVSYQIAWTVNTDQVKVVPGEDEKGDAIVTIDIVPEMPEADIPYVLKATLTDAEGNTATVEFSITIPKFAVTTWDEYMKAEEGDNVIVEGIVVAINSKDKGNTRNHLFIMDESGKGGYYSYQMDQDPIKDLNIAVGMTVRVSGPVTPYNGMQEIKGGTAKVLSTEIKTFDYVDITDKWVDGTNFNDFVALPVVIKGVTIGGQDMSESNKQYLYFELNGVKGYVRTYVTDFPPTLVASDKATIDAAHAAKFGYTADVTGILITYSGKPYIIPTSVDCFYNYVLPERTDAEKVEFEANSIELDSAIHNNKTIELPTVGKTYPNAIISWASDNACAVVDGGNVTFTLQDEAQTVKLTATITLGENTATKEFTITVDAKPTVVPSVVETPAADTAYKFFVAQNNLGQTLYLDGKVSTRYLSTTSDVTAAVDVYAEAAESGYKFYILVDGAKQYLEVYNNAENKTAVQYSAEGASVFTYNAETDAWETTLDGNSYYLGMYSTFNTVSVSSTSYINAGNTHVSQFPMELATLIDIADCVHVYSGDCDATCNICDTAREVEAEHTYDNACDAACNVCGAERTPADHVYDNNCDATCNVCEAVREVADHADNDGDGACDSCGMVSHTHVDANGDFVCDTDDCDVIVIAADTAFRMSIKQVTLGKTLYLNGGVNGRYLTMTENVAEAVDVYAEAVDGGYKFYILVDGAKQYIEIYNNDEGKLSVKYDAAGVCVYAYDATINAWVTNFDGTDYYLGTYSNYNTVNASKTSYISAENTGVSQFPMELTVIVDAADCEHAYDNDCDATCNICGAEREVADHVYDNACDATCNVCEARREVADHVDAEPDYVCDECGAALKQPGVEGESVTASKTIADLIVSEGWTNSTTKQSFALDSVVTVKVDGGNNSGKAYDGDHIRIYATDTPAGTLTISVADGYELVSIKVTTVTGTYAFLYVEGTTTDISNVETAVSGSSVVLNSVKNGSNGKQVRVLAIEVEYAAV